MKIKNKLCCGGKWFWYTHVWNVWVGKGFAQW